MEFYINTIKIFIEELNKVLTLQDSERREKIIIKNTMHFYIKSAKYAKILGFGKSDKVAIYKAKDGMDLESLINRFNMKSLKIIEMSQEPFYNYSRKLEFESVLAILIRTFEEAEYYKENNWYPTQFAKDIIIISLLIRTTIYFPISLDEERLKKSTFRLTAYPTKENMSHIYNKIEEYITEKSYKNYDSIGIAEDFLRLKDLNSIDNLIELLGKMELNNVRIMDVLEDLQNYEIKKVSINRHLIKEHLLTAFFHTISDYPLYYENESLYYDTILKLAQILKALYEEVRIEKE